MGYMSYIKSADVKIGTKLEHFILKDAFDNEFDSKASF